MSHYAIKGSSIITPHISTVRLRSHSLSNASLSFQQLGQSMPRDMGLSTAPVCLYASPASASCGGTAPISPHALCLTGLQSGILASQACQTLPAPQLLLLAKLSIGSQTLRTWPWLVLLLLFLLPKTIRFEDRDRPCCTLVSASFSVTTCLRLDCRTAFTASLDHSLQESAGFLSWTTVSSSLYACTCAPVHALTVSRCQSPALPAGLQC